MHFLNNFCRNLRVTAVVITYTTSPHPKQSQKCRNLCNWCSKNPQLALIPISRRLSSQWRRVFTMQLSVIQGPSTSTLPKFSLIKSFDQIQCLEQTLDFTIVVHSYPQYNILKNSNVVFQEYTINHMSFQIIESINLFRTCKE